MSQFIYIGSNLTTSLIESTLDAYLSTLGFKLVQSLDATELNPQVTSACGSSSWGPNTAAFNQFTVGPITLIDLTQSGAVGMAISIEVKNFVGWTNTSNIDVGFTIQYLLIGSTYTAGIPILQYNYSYNCSLINVVASMYGYNVPCYS